MVKKKCGHLLFQFLPINGKKKQIQIITNGSACTENRGQWTFYKVKNNYFVISFFKKNWRGFSSA